MKQVEQDYDGKVAMLSPDGYEERVTLDDEHPMWAFPSGKSRPALLFENHWHEHLEIHLVTEGTADLYCNQTCYSVRPGDVLVINSNVFHEGFCKSAYNSCVLIIDFTKFSSELSSHNYVFQPLIRDDPLLQTWITRILEEERDMPLGYKQQCKALVLNILVHLCRNYPDQVLSGRDALRRKQNLERISVVTDHIRQHYAEPVTVSQLADLLYLSEGRFCHLFREVMGCAPLQYLNDLRLQRAWTLLSTGHYTVTEVSSMVGFRDYNHFGRLFKKRYGTTPYQVKSGI